MKWKLTVAYDGAPYSGWQSQADGNAVQDHLERAVAAVEGKRAVVHGSGRTDAGVHALGQVAHFETTRTNLSARQWLRALNAHLPPTIRVLACVRAPASFHARFGAVGKMYRYRIYAGEVLPPLELGRCWPVHKPLDFETMKEAAQLFVGRHDFAAFAANRGKVNEDTVRTIERIAVSRKGPLIELTFTGEGFLYKMVRMLAGAIVKTAAGQEDISALRARLKNGTPKWNHVAPAEGLFLVRVRYARRATSPAD